MTKLSVPSNMQGISGALYDDRDFTITQAAIKTTRHSYVSLARLYSFSSSMFEDPHDITVAVKSPLRFFSAADPDQIEQQLALIQREVDHLSAIKHRKKFAEIFVTNLLSVGHNAVAFRYYQHGDLHGFLGRNHAVISTLQRLLLARSFLQCMNFIDKIDLLHRDIKATNILLEDDGSLRLCDFAHAKFKHDDSCVPYGTTLYQSPKIMRHLMESLNTDDQTEDKYSTYDERYCVALVLWQIFTGLLPYGEYTAIINHHFLKDFHDEIDQGFRPRMPKSLDGSIASLIQNGWHRNEQARPQFSQTQSCVTDVITGVTSCL